MGVGKHVAMRTCIVCGSKRPQRELVRLVCIEGGAIEVDLTRKKVGRGAYICRSPECWQNGSAGHRLERAFRSSVAPGSWDQVVCKLKEIYGGERR